MWKQQVQCVIKVGYLSINFLFCKRSVYFLGDDIDFFILRESELEMTG